MYRKGLVEYCWYNRHITSTCRQALEIHNVQVGVVDYCLYYNRHHFQNV